MKFKSLIPAVAMTLLSAMASAPALAAPESYSFNFNAKFAGQGPEVAETFATLSISTVDHKIFSFTLNVLNNLSALFGNNSYIDGLLFNTASSKNPSTSQVTGSGNGVQTVLLEKEDEIVGGVRWEFEDNFDCTGRGCTTAKRQLVDGEHLTWQTTYSKEQPNPWLVAPGVAMEVSGIDINEAIRRCGGSQLGEGYYISAVTPVPEPETYAMMLAGLGLMGTIARRRKNKNA
jgi:hypothetical protein